MTGAAGYGAILGLAGFAFTRLLPQPVGSMLFWSGLAAYLAWGAIVWWRRTGLALTSAAVAIGSFAAAILVGLAIAGRVYPDIPVEWWILLATLCLVAAACMVAESRIHRGHWRRCRGCVEGKSPWDVLRGRHVPDLRNEL